jgi:hypothetical protein
MLITFREARFHFGYDVTKQARSKRVSNFAFQHPVAHQLLVAFCLCFVLSHLCPNLLICDVEVSILFRAMS